MPASESEIRTMLIVVARHVPILKARRIATDLWEEVGQHTANDSLRQTLLDLKTGADNAPIVPTPGDYLCWASIVALHWVALVVEVGLLLCIPIGCILGWLPLWLLILMFPAGHFIVWIGTSRVADCPFTRWENRIREERLGWPRVRGFIGHYRRTAMRWYLRRFFPDALRNAPNQESHRAIEGP